jgi:hypothetical protein
LIKLENYEFSPHKGVLFNSIAINTVFKAFTRRGIDIYIIEVTPGTYGSRHINCDLKKEGRRLAKLEYIEAASQRRRNERKEHWLKVSVETEDHKNFHKDWRSGHKNRPKWRKFGAYTASELVKLFNRGLVNSNYNFIPHLSPFCIKLTVHAEAKCSLFSNDFTL